MQYSRPSIKCVRKRQPPISANFAPPPVEAGGFTKETGAAVEDQAGPTKDLCKDTTPSKRRVRCEENHGQ